MTPANIIDKEPRTVAAKSGTTAWRIRFVSVAPAGAEVLGRFVDPVNAVAVAQPLDPLASPSRATAPEPTDQLDVLVRSSPTESDSASAAWLNPPDHVNAPLPVSVPIGRGRITWCPGRALVEGAGLRGELLGAIAEFAFYEAQLRRLEEALLPYETSAIDDVQNAYRITKQSRERGEQFGQTMESLALLRLSFARLEPRLLTPSRSFRLLPEG